MEFIEGETTSLEVNVQDDYSSQTIEEALDIIQEAMIPSQATQTSDLFVGGNMDSDDVDTDEDSDDFDTNDDFVCAV